MYLCDKRDVFKDIEVGEQGCLFGNKAGMLIFIGFLNKGLNLRRR